MGHLWRGRIFSTLIVPLLTYVVNVGDHVGAHRMYPLVIRINHALLC